MKELFGDNGLFKDQDPSSVNNCEDMLDLLEKNAYASQLLDENEIEPLELVASFTMLSGLETAPTEFNFELFMIKTTGIEQDRIIARRLILIMTELELIYRVRGNSANFYITSEMRDLSERVSDALDF